MRDPGGIPAIVTPGRLNLWGVEVVLLVLAVRLRVVWCIHNGGRPAEVL